MPVRMDRRAMVRTGVGGSARIATLVSGACRVVAEVCFEIIDPIDGTCGGATLTDGVAAVIGNCGLWAS
jgi:hypothetical protein